MRNVLDVGSYLLLVLVLAAFPTRQLNARTVSHHTSIREICDTYVIPYPINATSESAWDEIRVAEATLQDYLRDRLDWTDRVAFDGSVLTVDGSITTKTSDKRSDKKIQSQARDQVRKLLAGSFAHPVTMQVNVAVVRVSGRRSSKGAPWGRGPIAALGPSDLKPEFVLSARKVNYDAIWMAVINVIGLGKGFDLDSHSEVKRPGYYMIATMPAFAERKGIVVKYRMTVRMKKVAYGAEGTAAYLETLVEVWRRWKTTNDFSSEPTTHLRDYVHNTPWKGVSREGNANPILQAIARRLRK